MGTNLWFTTDKGGAYDAGTVSRFDLVTRDVVEVASFDNQTGKGSESALLVLGDNGLFHHQERRRGKRGDHLAHRPPERGRQRGVSLPRE